MVNSDNKPVILSVLAKNLSMSCCSLYPLLVIEFIRVNC